MKAKHVFAITGLSLAMRLIFKLWIKKPGMCHPG